MTGASPADSRAKGCLIAAIIWILILGALAAAYRYLVHPHFAKKLSGETGSASLYRDEIVVAADSFSGYAVLRSEDVRNELKARKIKFTVSDDKADYSARLRALREGQVQMAVFTIDSLLTAGAKAGEFPATIVQVIDETNGGDAIVAYRDAIPTLQDLNSPEARFVLTPGSPSEFLARVVMAHFQLSRLADNWKLDADGAGEVFERFRRANASEKRAYVLWEPYVSRALERPGAHVLIDSSKLRGYIVDVLVARREFLRDHPELVQAVVETHARALWRHSQQPDGLMKLVQEDGRKTGSESLDESKARKVVAGIQWKNTLENYAHFGLVSGPEAGGLPNLEDMIGNILGVLVKTGALTTDPLPGQHHTLFHDKTLAGLRANRFHPSQGIGLIDDSSTTNAALDPVRAERSLPALAPEQWQRLRPVGELKLEPISFGRGSGNLTLDGERTLRELAHRLQSFPRYYLRVIGHTRAEGDPEANRLLAEARADAAARFLVAEGVAANRVHAEAAAPAATGGSAQAVSFFVGEIPY